MSAALPSERARPALGTGPPSLWADRGCPFAHRVLALCEHLGWPLERHEFRVGDVPPGLARYSPSNRMPLLVHGDLVIGESRVMLEHLAEHCGFTEALPADLPSRTLHRHAMAIVDGFVVPRLTTTAAEAEPARLDEMLDTLERAAAATAQVPCLLTFHAAPIWLRLCWWNPEGSVSRGIEGRPALRVWLDTAVALEAVARTAPDRAAHSLDLERARERGLIPSDRADPVPSPTSACTTPTQSRQSPSAGAPPRSQ